MNRNLTIMLGLFFPVVLITSACQNKTQKLLAKKWDCVKIENLDPIDASVVSKEDSVAAQKLQTALQELVWTFNGDNTYQCSAGTVTTVQGTYKLTDDNTMLSLTSNTQNTSNTYVITSLTPTDMVLTTTGTEVPLILRFREH